MYDRRNSCLVKLNSCPNFPHPSIPNGSDWGILRDDQTALVLFGRAPVLLDRWVGRIGWMRGMGPELTRVIDIHHRSQFGTHPSHPRTRRSWRRRGLRRACPRQRLASNSPGLPKPGWRLRCRSLWRGARPLVVVCKTISPPKVRERDLCPPMGSHGDPPDISQGIPPGISPRGSPQGIPPGDPPRGSVSARLLRWGFMRA